MNQAIALLDVTKHWTVKCVNRKGRRAHECTIWHNGKRVTAQAASPLMAITAAWAKIRGDAKAKFSRSLKVVG